MVTYKISGSLPASWEDFYCLDSRFPHVTILTRRNLEDFGPDACDGQTPEGWLDIVIDSKYICLDLARLAIADALAIENPEDVLIIEGGFCQAV